MLSYRHAFHAGNHADVLKHTALSLLIAAFRRKDKPFIYIDTHAGGGAYDLKSAWANKTAEYHGGIAPLWQAQQDWSALDDYFSVIRELNQTNGQVTGATQQTPHRSPSSPPNSSPRYYPGSPRIAQHLLRPQDKLTLVELHNNEIQQLRDNMRHDDRVSIHHRDGFEALPALLPPTPRRGLVLIDPPYEVKTDYQTVVNCLQQAAKRWATGTYVVWYPILGHNRDQSRVMLKKLQQANLGETLIAELEVAAQTADTGMNGSGLAIINPPWQLGTQLNAILPRLCSLLISGEGERWRVALQ